MNATANEVRRLRGKTVNQLRDMIDRGEAAKWAVLISIAQRATISSPTYELAEELWAEVAHEMPHAV